MKRALPGWLLVLLVLAGCSRDWDSRRASPTARLPANETVVQVDGTVATPGDRPGFAGFPDHGELASYPTTHPAAVASRRQGAHTWHQVDISEAHALHAITGRPLRITTPSGELLDFRYQRHVEHPSGDWTWIGQLEGGAPSDQAIVTFGAQAVFGSIAQRDDVPLRLTMRDGVSWMVETDQDMLARIKNAAGGPAKPDYLVPPKLADWTRASGAPEMGHEAATAGTAASISSTTAGIAATTVDVVLGYTNGYAAAMGGQSAAVTRLNNLVDTANLALQNSRLAWRFQMVHAMQVNYPDNTANETALEQLTGFVVPSTETTPNPAFNALRVAREQHGADLVSLVRKFSDPENGGCGIAWLIGGGQTPITPEYEFFGYSVVSDGDDGAFTCRDEALAHELAHNMGSAHDRETAKGDDGTLDPDEYGRYVYSFGHKTGAGSGNFFTVMSYGSSGQVPYRVFSNPRTTFCGGRPCGVVNQADNARSLEQTITPVSQFRSGPPASAVDDLAPGITRSDINGDGNDDVFYRNAGQFVYWLMDGTVRISWRQYTVKPDTAFAGYGDFDGNGQADLVWIDTSRQVFMWLGSGPNFTYRNIHTHNAGWSLVGFADIDGDERDDLLWYNPQLRQLVVWFMNGFTRTSYRVFTVPANYRFAGSGDFNDDGKGDLLWDNPARDLYMWIGSGTTFASTYLRTYQSGWSLIGTRDIDGNGRSDIQWRNQASGQFTYWLMDGPLLMSYRVFTMSGAFESPGTGDFNGDGLGDVMWRNSARQLYFWLGDGVGFNNVYVATNGEGWSVIN